MKINRKSQKIKRYFRFQISFFVIVIILWLIFNRAPAGNPAPAPRRNPANPSVQSGRGTESLKQALNSSLVNFRSSLEMKENVDFLLTPALLVQEAISEDVVITYPSE
jgi:hypothetical protein